MELLKILVLGESEVTALKSAGKVLNEMVNTENDGLSRDTEELLLALKSVLDEVLNYNNSKKQ